MRLHLDFNIIIDTKAWRAVSPCTELEMNRIGLFFLKDQLIPSNTVFVLNMVIELNFCFVNAYGRTESMSKCHEISSSSSHEYHSYLWNCFRIAKQKHFTFYWWLYTIFQPLVAAILCATAILKGDAKLIQFLV